ncbi:formyltetrahydrofolate deformylase [Haloechinothrix alba]|uniref:Formyltetrahydrofolate deformylase n=1 Tax=Haloechinothrix alba TaxID=664784 RepID=A0A238ZCK8_9PSEU|nr:formyltetrahydrofolate deformylase [Haloechinothrix alba]SNR80503.1 formyltetrahydrofolate deformylase [Haloechinothrix alba]
METVEAEDPSERRFVITFGCPDRVGIVARIASFLAELGGWIVEAAYHTDPDTGWFFTRQEVRADSLPYDVEELRSLFSPVAASLGAGSDADGGVEGSQWRIDDTGDRRRMVLLVSTDGHCLYDLLGRVAGGELNVDVPAVIGNHESLGEITEAFGIDFHHVPFPKDADGKAAAFDRVRTIVDEHDPDAIVLARFMQILPPELCQAWAGRAVNIHHSFLPSFVGARPYHQAHSRGVKLIGATCHYVTAELDAGPIIEQDVIRVDHSDTVADMVRRGRDIEKVVLARGLRWHLEHRVLVHAGRTVVF